MVTEGLTPEEMLAEEEEMEEVYNDDDEDELDYDPDFLEAVKRVIYGTESLLETVDSEWSEEVDAILEDIKEVRKAWPTDDDC
jgi:hypothetical protein